MVTTLIEFWSIKIGNIFIDYSSAIVVIIWMYGWLPRVGRILARVNNEWVYFDLVSFSGTGDDTSN